MLMSRFSLGATVKFARPDVRSKSLLWKMPCSCERSPEMKNEKFSPPPRADSVYPCTFALAHCVRVIPQQRRAQQALVAGSRRVHARAAREVAGTPGRVRRHPGVRTR
jgi:hypothetical protein